MTNRKHVKLVHEGGYAAEVEVTLTDTDKSWGPYLSLSDVERIDALRQALRNGDVKTAETFGRVYRLVPVSAA
ncbi:MAG: hypothetical protein JW849_04175 [Phycisphaerae bacterium]|nr:hypothetical protein [Phycisphaerae bacterium]